MSSPDRPLGAPLKLRTFGGGRIEGPDGSVVDSLMQRRRLALLALLAGSDGGLSRDRIIGLLWPESEEEKARHVLAQVVHSLRRDFAKGVIEASPTTLRLNPNVLSSDVQEFTAALAAGKLEIAADLYRGSFLDGFYLNDCPDFERWTEERRAALAYDAERTLESLAQNAATPADAVAWWRRLAMLRRFDSRIALLLMQAMARAGDRAGAIEHARAHAELLRRELEQGAPPELAAFVETLRVSTSPADTALSAAAPTFTAAVESTVLRPEVLAPEPRRRRRWRSAAGVGALAALGAGAALTIGLRTHGTASPRWVIVTDAVNTTGDRAFDHTVPLALTALLTQSPRVRIETPDRVTRALERMRRAGADSVLDEKLAREIAERDGVEVVAVPAVHRADNTYELSAKLVDGATGELLAFVSERAATRGDVLEALDRLGRKIRRELGEPRRSVNATAVSLPRVTTTSLDALKKFADGSRAYREARYVEADRLWTEAVTLDSTFATAHASLGMLAWWSNAPTKGEAHYANALRHLGGLPDREQMLIRASSKRGRSDFSGSAQILEEYLAQHPDDIDVRARMGYDYMRMNESAKAVAAFTTVLSVDSLDQSSWINLATAESNLGHTPEAIRAYRRASALAPTLLTENNNLNLEFASALVLAHQLDSARAVVTLLINHSDVFRRARGLRSMSYIAAYGGQYAEAARALAQANAVLRSTPQGAGSLSEMRNSLLLATVLTELGRTSEAARELDNAYTIVMRIDTEGTFVYWAGKALARAGDTRRAAAILAALEKKARPNSPTDRASLEALRGETAVARGRPADATPHLDAAWLSDSVSSVVLESRAFAAEAAGDLPQATALYQRIAENRRFGSEGQYAWQMAPYRLGRLYERANRPADARASYERFLANLPRPDSSLSAVVDTRARLRVLATK